MSADWQQWLLVAAGGALGGALRYAISGWVAKHVGETFPWGTLVVNASGAFLLALLMGSSAFSSSSDGVRLLLGVGVIASYTTVSSLSLQTLSLAREGQLRAAAAYVGLSVVTGLAAGALGWWLVRL
ncbi:fluoride efflux transporter CrcB [Pseudoxanthomonas sp. UTMC 1351]|uniref:fluoride efflux transporter CrcB n=1 Tax=Pseudoxanthomonas sp. UTMC 1351 TaxID=2695853 RepID=UPI0034CEAC93